MRNLIKFILKNHFGILFIALEFVAFILLIRNNDYQKAGTLNFIQKIDGRVHQKSMRYRKYLHLQEENERLVNENLRLRRAISNIDYELLRPGNLGLDTSLMKRFDFLPAKVINNSTNKQYNYITLNVGEKDGVLPGMGVISPDGVVGVVKSISANYARVISVINRDFGLSARIKSSRPGTSNAFGPVTWEGENYRRVNLHEIPFHIELQEGDTIVTSGYSTIFPENITLGFIHDFELEGANYYNIEVDLVTDMKRLLNVYVIKNKIRTEIENLENEDDQ